MLSVEDMIKLNEFKLYYKFNNKELPYYHMTNLENAHNDQRTRNNILLKIQYKNTKVAERDIFSRCPRTINNAAVSFTSKVVTHKYKAYVRYIRQQMISDYSIECNRADCQDIHCIGPQ